MTAAHIIFIPGVLLVGIAFGYSLGARAVRLGFHAVEIRMNGLGQVKVNHGQTPHKPFGWQRNNAEGKDF